MKVSELIIQLAKHIEQHGDSELIFDRGEGDHRLASFDLYPCKGKPGPRPCGIKTSVVLVKGYVANGPATHLEVSVF